MPWQDDLQPASWRGLPFFVDTSDLLAGRGTAVHAYPFREKNWVWVEDLGKLPSSIQITGFLIGDDVRQQHMAFFNAMMQPGRGDLVHPVYGTQPGSIVGGCKFALRRDKGRYVEVSFQFIANKEDAPYPAAQPDTQANVQTAAAGVQQAASTSFLQQVGGFVASVQSAVGAAFAAVSNVLAGPLQLLATARAFVGLVSDVIFDAASIIGSVYGLAGEFGRDASPTPDPALTSESQALSLATSERSALTAACNDFVAAVQSRGDIPTATQAVLSQILIALPDPGEQIRVCLALLDLPATDPLATLCRNSTVAVLAQAASAYQPTSYDDAQAVLAQVTDAISDQVTAAGDAGDDTGYVALSSLQVAVVADLNARGASLAPLVTRTFNESLPHLALAEILYDDASRADELIRRVDPPHPLFFPKAMTVLAS